MLLGSDAVPLHGLEPDRQPDGVRVPDLQPAANPFGPAGARGVEPPHVADNPPVVARRGSRDPLSAAILRFLQLAGAHGVDIESARQGAGQGLGEDAAATTRIVVSRFRPPRRTLSYRLLRETVRFRLAAARTRRVTAPHRPPSLADHSLSLSRARLPSLRPWPPKAAARPAMAAAGS